jgi:prostaglandin-endoperoxide synthase 2
VTAALREPGSGRLRTRRLGRRLGEAEFPARLFGDDGALQPGLAGLPYLPDDPATVDLTPLGRGHPLPPPKGEMRTVDVLLRRLRLPEPDARARWQRLHATGLETGNATLLHAAINTILIRQHNRACDMLRQDNPGWDQDRVFETARATTLVALLRLVVNEYINHIAGLPFRLSLDRSFAERQGWYRTNRISVEFNLLYRWHSAVPDPLVIGERRLHWQEYGMNPALMEELGPERIIAAASRQRAGQIGLRNTPEFLLGVDQASIAFGRATRVQPYNAYRRHFGLDPYRSFAELTGDPDLAAQLEALYGQVDDVELVVGLLAEKPYPPALFGQLMLVMVGSDAFTHILTNPLLAGRVYEACFSEASQRLIEGVTSLQGLVEANAQGVPRDEVLASFTAAD